MLVLASVMKINEDKFALSDLLFPQTISSLLQFILGLPKGFDTCSGIRNSIWNAENPNPVNLKGLEDNNAYN